MASKKGSWLDKYLLGFLVRILKAMPHRAALGLGASLGTLLWALSKRRVDRAERRCVAALGVGVTSARRIVRASYANMGRSVAEFVRLPLLHARLSSLVAIEGKKNLDDALARGRGVLLMTAHIGSWELAGARLVAEGYPIAPIYTPQRNRGGIEDFIRRQRVEDAGMDLIPSEGFGLRAAFRALRDKHVLTFLQDLDARREGIHVPFLGMEASTATGIVRMYRKYGSPVVPAVVVREPDGMRHTIHVGEILSDLCDEDGASFGENMEKSLQMCNNILGGWVERYPEQWMWLLDRWESVLREKAR